jgi:L-ascorbate metabolism protein UlaG (beta-lactamase superfamily)
MLQPVQISASFFGPRSDTVVAWLGMAGVLINSRGTILLIDPLLSVSRQNGDEIVDSGDRLLIHLPLEVEQVLRADAVLYTHADDDHYGAATARNLDVRLRPMFLAPPPVLQRLAEENVTTERLVTARDGASFAIGQTEVVITPALHNWPRKPAPWQRGDCCGFLIRTLDGTIWHPGDTRLIDELLAIRGVDVLFFDVAAVESHLGPAGSARLAQTSGARVLVAYHYGTFDLPPGTYGSCDPQQAVPYVHGLHAQFLLANPGELLRLPLGDGRLLNEDQKTM